MKKILLFLILFLLTAPALAETVWDFNFDSEGWRAEQFINHLRVEAGILKGELSGAMPVLLSPDLFLDADKNQLLELRMKSSSSQGIVFWTGILDTSLHTSKQIPFPTRPDNEFHTYYIDLKSQNKYWSGTIGKIALVPATASGKFEIDYLKVGSGNIFSKTISGWSEFWGPKGRELTGLTINNIKSSTFAGKPINYYLYTALLLIFIFSFIKDRNSANKTFIKALILLWVLLEVNTLLNQFSVAKKDFALAGKPIGTKQAYVTGWHFFNYLKFCNTSLPPKSSYRLISSEGYFLSKAAYYLYPHKSSAIPDYYLVYQNKPDQALSGCQLYAKKNEQEYILKCK